MWGFGVGVVGSVFWVLNPPELPQPSHAPSVVVVLFRVGSSESPGSKECSSSCFLHRVSGDLVSI